MALLRRRSLLPDDATERQVVEALHRLLTWAPSRLLGVQLADAVGDRRPQNQPGTDQEYPNWRMPLADGVGPARAARGPHHPAPRDLARAGGRPPRLTAAPADHAGTARERELTGRSRALAERVRRGAFLTADAAARRGGRR